jgi:mannosyltransferase
VSTWRRWMPVLVVFVLALAIRLWGLGDKPLWLDEAFTYVRAGMTTPDLVADSLRSHHTPTFFLVEALMRRMGAGSADPQVWLRVPAAIAGAISVSLAFVIARRLGGMLAGIGAALFLGLAPTELAYSQEARSYTMEMALILVSLLGVVALAEQPRRAALAWRDKAAPRAAWLAFTLGAAGALDVLGDAFPWVLAANCGVAAVALASGARRRAFANLLRADLIITVLAAPIYVAMTFAVGGQYLDSPALSWIPPLSVGRAWYALASVYFLRLGDMVSFRLWPVDLPHALLWFVAALSAGAILAGIWQLRRRPVLAATIASAFVLLPALLIGLSFIHPMLLPRYLLWSAGPAAILAGIGVAAALRGAPRRYHMPAMAGIAVLLAVNLSPYFSAETKPRWDIAARILQNEVGPGDVVLMNDTYAALIMQAYLPDGKHNVILGDISGDMKQAQLAQLQGKRIWAVFGRAGQVAESHEWPKFYAALSPLGTPTSVEMAGSRIRILLFDPASEPTPVACVQPPPVPAEMTASAPLAIQGTCG